MAMLGMQMLEHKFATLEMWILDSNCDAVNADAGMQNGDDGNADIGWEWQQCSEK